MAVGRLHVGVLGPFEVLIGGAPAGPAGAKRRGLLAVLALHANSVVPVSLLVLDRLWGEEPPASAVNIVQTYVSAWRKALGADPLVTVGAGYRLELSAPQSDLLSYRALVSQARGCGGPGAPRGGGAPAGRRVAALAWPGAGRPVRGGFPRPARRQP